MGQNREVPAPSAHKPITLLRRTTETGATSIISNDAPKASSSNSGESPSVSAPSAANSASVAASNAVVSSSDEAAKDFETSERWESDNIHLDFSKLATQVKRLVGDMEMLQSCLVGDRRSRPFTPGSSDRPAKVPRDTRSREPAQPLQFDGISSRDILEGLAEEGDEGSQDVQEVSGEQVVAMHFNYEEWDVSRYKRAKTEKARGLFWASASDEAKRKMTDALLHEPAGAAVTVQAREKLWIPF